MKDAATCPSAHLDAAYVLGALSAEERLEFERHLPGCRACSQAVQQLAGLPGLLAQVSPDVLESEQLDPPLPDTLLPALVQEVRRTRRRRLWTVGLAAAAAVVVAVGIGTVALVSSDDDGGSTAAPPPASTSLAPAQEMEQLDQTSVWGTISLTSVGWGTRLDLECSYEAPTGGYQDDDGPPVYVLVVHTREGGVEQVASWKGLPGEPVHVTGATALTTDEIATVEVRTADGRPVLEITS